MRIKLNYSSDAEQKSMGIPDDEDFEVDLTNSGSEQVLTLTLILERLDDEWYQQLYDSVSNKMYELHGEILGKLTERVKESTKTSVRKQRMDPSRLP